MGLGTKEAHAAELIPGGTFVMGTDAANIAWLKKRYGVGLPGVFENETPAHRVTVGALEGASC